MDENRKLARKLGFWAALGGSVGLVISGTSILSVGFVAGTAGSAAWLPALLSLIPMIAAATSYSELVAMFPGGGMTSEYTRPALGNFWGLMAILWGYVLLVMVDGGMQEAVGAQALADVIGVPYQPIVFVILILVTCINLFGVGLYGTVEITLTLTFISIWIGLSLLGIFGVGDAYFGAEAIKSITPFEPENGWNAAFMCTGTAIWFYIGFEYVCPMAEENKKPYKNIPAALLIGLFLIFIADYLFCFIAVQYTPLELLASSPTPAIVGMSHILGDFGKYAMTTVTVLAAFTTGIAHQAGLSRMLYGLAHRGFVPKIFCWVHPKWRTPWASILTISGMFLVTIIYILFKGTEGGVFVQLINISCVTYMTTYAIAIIDVIVLRINKRPLTIHDTNKAKYLED